MGFLQVAIFGLLFNLAYGHHENVHSMHQEKINLIQKSIFTPEYNVNIRPYGENGTTLITVQLKDVRVLGLDETTGRLTFQAFYRQEWVDSRLAYNETEISYLPVRECKGMWIPDLYFVNGVETLLGGHSRPAQLVRVYPSGKVLYSVRLTQTVSCPEVFQKDATQIVCGTSLSSYGYYNDDVKVVFNAKQGVSTTNTETNLLQKYKFEGVSITECQQAHKSGDDYEHSHSCIAALFKFTPQTKY